MRPVAYVLKYRVVRVVTVEKWAPSIESGVPCGVTMTVGACQPWAINRYQAKSEVAMTARRIEPLDPAQFSPRQQAVAGEMAQYNFARVMVHHPDLYQAYIPFAQKLMTHSLLTPRDREILILRTLELCNEGYDAPHHRAIARQIGMADAEIDCAREGREKCLAPHEQVLLTVAQELVQQHAISDETWRLLAQHYDRQQLMEIVFLVGNYSMMAMATKSFGIVVEDAFEKV